HRSLAGSVLRRRRSDEVSTPWQALIPSPRPVGEDATAAPDKQRPCRPARSAFAMCWSLIPFQLNFQRSLKLYLFVLMPSVYIHVYANVHVSYATPLEN